MQKKTDFKRAGDADTMKFAEKADAARLKPEFDELDIDELETTPVDLIKLSDVVKIKSLNKTDCIWWLRKVMSFILVGLLKKTDYDNKTNYIEGKLPVITSLAYIASVKNEIPNVSYLVKKKKKKVYDANIWYTEKKYFITFDYKKKSQMKYFMQR